MRVPLSSGWRFRLRSAAGLAVCFALAGEAAVGQSSAIRFRQLSVEEGLPNNNITGIVQDPRGFMWIATWEGLVRFDGNRLRSYSPDPSTPGSLANHQVGELHVDREGVLWVGSNGGLQRYDASTDSFVDVPLESVLVPTLKMPTAILKDSDGDLWVGIWRNGVVRLDGSTGETRHYVHDHDDPASLVNDIVPRILQDNTGRIWFATYGGLQFYDPDRDGFVLAADASHPLAPIPTSGILSMDLDAEGMLWLGTEAGIARLDPGTGGLLPVPRLPGIRITAVSATGDGRVLLGHPVGLDVVDLAQGTSRRFEHKRGDPASLAPGAVHALGSDASGVIWVGTDRGGISWSDPNGRRFRQLDLEGGAAAVGYVTAVLEGRDGDLWIGAERGLWLRQGPSGAFRRLTTDDGLASHHILSLLEDRTGTVWAGTNGGGLARWDPVRLRFETFSPPWEGIGYLHTLAELDDRTLLVGSFNGLMSFDPSTGRFVERWLPDADDPAALKDPFVTALYQDSQGRIWVGHSLGLERFDRPSGRFVGLTEAPDDSPLLPEGTVMAIVEDSAGSLWLSFLPGAVVRFDPDRLTADRYSKASHGLSSDHAYGIVPDKQDVWIGTGDGMNRLDPVTGQNRLYRVPNASQHSIHGLGSYDQGPSGRIYFGGLGGLYSFLPDSLVQDISVPFASISAIRIDDHSDDEAFSSTVIYNPMSGAHFPLSFDERSLQIDFSVLHFWDPTGNTWRYRLRGFETGFHRGARAAEATYTNLNPGTYVFELTGQSSEGVSSAVTELSFRIRPPWWGTWWFRLLVFVSIVGSALAGYRYRVRSLRQRSAELGRLVRERTQTVESQRAALEVQAIKLTELDEMKSRFFSNISHELRTPLTLIRGRLQDLLNERHGRVTQESTNQLALTLSQTERLQQLVEQLLDLARFQEERAMLRVRKGDLSAFVRRVVGLFESLAHLKGIALQTSTPGPLPLWFDPDKMEKIVTNLIGNALKFTDVGGEVAVSLESLNQGDEESGFVALRVRDTGIGIPADLLPHVLERFYQVDSSSTRPYEGMGVGLALVKELVDLHGGELRVDSVEGRGSTFTVLLPVGADHFDASEIEDADPAEPSETARTTLRQLSAQPNRGTKGEPLILVVEDNEELSGYLADHLRVSHAVITARDGLEGLEMARRHRPELIVSDVMMPGKSGFALLANIREDPDLAATPFILLTARTAAEDRLRGLRGRADAYIDKPFNIRELKARIQALLANREAMRTSLAKREPESTAPESAASTFADQARQLIRRHLSDPELSRADLADGLFVSERTLARRLAEATGQTPTDFARSVRLQAAHELLVAGAYRTVAEVASAVGFKTPSYFARLYRKAYGELPGTVLAERGDFGSP